MGAEHLDQPTELQKDRRALALALMLNAALAAALLATGLYAQSSALIATALDNASDAGVYAISYYAASRGARWKVRAARVSGIMLFVLCGGVLVDVARRFFSGVEPVSFVIMVMAVVAAGVNIACLRILRPHRADDVNFRAAWTFSTNDLISNIGVLIAGILVAILGRAWPDIVVGVAIALVAGWGAIKIIRDARQQENQDAVESTSRKQTSKALEAAALQSDYPANSQSLSIART